jgi:tricorn protease interacting factor F2/3
LHGDLNLQIASYDLILDVDFDKSSVEGVVDIEVQGAEAPLVLNAEEMRIESVEINGIPKRFTFDEAKCILIVHEIPKKKAVVRVNYSKQITDDAIVGLYKSKFGRDHLLATDLEPARARSVFPCKDEPSYKAIFRLCVVTQRDLTAISNTRVVSSEDMAGGKKRVVFEPTPRMSTYLFFLGVGKFEEEKKESGGVDFIAASRAGLINKTELALEVASEVLKEYGNYFSIPYPLPKLHLVALPEYRAGAMENWGAITFREALLLADSSSSTSDRRGVAHVIAHEIAHMWFGDLVTMKWWDDLWLNESFATFMDHKVLERLHPEWDNWREFLRGSTFPALNADALSDTHPIQTEVKKVEEIEGIFGPIVYGKGASVLRMIESYIDEKQFRKGVSAYLKKFRYSNARGEDLWLSLGKASGLPVSRLARAWITNAGFPVVSVTTSKGRVRFSQSRFRFRGKSRGETWPIPLTYTVDGKPQKKLLERRSASSALLPERSLIVNPGRTGFYSVLYDKGRYDQIAKDFTNLHSHDRAGILNDLYLFMRAGMVEPEAYFRFVSLCGDILDPLSAETVVDQLVNLRGIAGEAEIVRRSCLQFYRSQYRRLGLRAKAGEDENIGEVRETILTQLARTDIGLARKLAPMFREYASLDPDLKAAVAVAHVVAGGDNAFEALMKLMKSERNEAERIRLYRALTSSSSPKSVRECLELSVSGEVSRSDSVYASSFASANPVARSELWEWFTRRYDLLKETYGLGIVLGGVSNVVPRCGVGRETEVRRFFSGKRYKEGADIFKRAFELLEVNSALRKKLLTA